MLLLSFNYLCGVMVSANKD